MVVTCQACGASSHDLEFCDHCNADLTSASPAPAPRICPLAPNQSLYLSAEQAGALARPEASVTLYTLDQAWRLHWVPQADWPMWSSRLEARRRCRCPVLPPCHVIEDAHGVWVAAEACPTRLQPWLQPAAADPLLEIERLVLFAAQLAQTLEELEAHGLVWLTFDPQELEQLGTQIRITNLDLSVYPIGSCPDPLLVRPSYVAPEVCRFRGADVSPRTDVYHLAIFAYYWLARLLPGGFPGQGLESFGHALPPLRIFLPALPPGIASVISRGLAVDPSQRPPSPTAFLAELRRAAQQARARAESQTPIRWEAGWHTRTGRAKFALDRPNEDHGLLRRYEKPDRLLAIVADGITTCDVGSGALASRLTCAVFEKLLNADCHLDSFPSAARTACREAAQGLLDWAIEEGYGEYLLQGSDLMGTTVTAAWLEANRLALANLGDSRAYLVTPEYVEALTVDGDLGSALVLLGMPPEEIRGFGAMARSLRECVGGSVRVVEGELHINESYCTPTTSFWTLQPGDVVVLCSDGLVDEGVFLEPAQLADLVRRHRHLPPEELAIKLADAADAMQRLPSPLDLDGFGDNITSVVIKILDAP